jgi:hypothetical protein
MAHVCQPLAMTVPKIESAAASGSTWNGCGSYRRANASISSSVTVHVPRLEILEIPVRLHAASSVAKPGCAMKRARWWSQSPSVSSIVDSRLK